MSTTTQTATPSPDLISSFIDLLSTSYLSTPLTTALITEIDSTSTSSSRATTLTPARLHKHFSLGIPQALHSNILLSYTTSTTNPSTLNAAALFEPPDFCGVPPSHARPNPGPILSEWRRTARRLKSKYLSLPDTGPGSFDTPAAPSQASGGPAEDPYPGDFNKDIDFEIRPFWGLAMLGRGTEERSDEGPQKWDNVKSCLQPVLDKARQDGIPVWTEGSDEGVVRWLVQELGFRVVEEVVVGKGRVDGTGWPDEKGDGVRCWALIYE